MTGAAWAGAFPPRPPGRYQAQLLALRRILVPSLVDTGADRPVPDVVTVWTSVLEVTRAYHESHLARALGALPDLLRDTERAAVAHEGVAATKIYRLLAHTYITTSRTLVQIRHEDLAYESTRRAMAYAEKAGPRGRVAAWPRGRVAGGRGAGRPGPVAGDGSGAALARPGDTG